MVKETVIPQMGLCSLEWMHQPFVVVTGLDGWHRPVPAWLGETEHLASGQMM